MITGLIVLGALILSACAFGETSRRRESPERREIPPLPEWTKKLGQAPEVARRCSIDEEIAALAAEADARRNIVDHYCGQDASPFRPFAQGTFFMSHRARIFTDLRGEEPCIYVEIAWGAMQCLGEGAPSPIIVNPALKIEP